MPHNPPQSRAMTLAQLLEMVPDKARGLVTVGVQGVHITLPIRRRGAGRPGFWPLFLGLGAVICVLMWLAPATLDLSHLGAVEILLLGLSNAWAVGSFVLWRRGGEQQVTIDTHEIRIGGDSFPLRDALVERSQTGRSVRLTLDNEVWDVNTHQRTRGAAVLDNLTLWACDVIEAAQREEPLLRPQTTGVVPDELQVERLAKLREANDKNGGA